MEIVITNLKQDYEDHEFIKKHIDNIRNHRNDCLLKTDYLILNDSGLNEVKLNKVKAYGLELRDFMNKLMNNEIECNIFLHIDDFKDKYFPKLE